MPNIQGKDAANATIFIRSTRAGTDGEPHFSTEDTIDRIGPVAEAAPSTDTASSALNGRLQRVAQRITSLLTLFPSSIGQKNKAGSLSVTLASDQDALPVAGTFFQATQPVSAAELPLPTGAATDANQATQLGSTRGTITAANTSAANAAATFTITAPGADNFTQLVSLYFGYGEAPTAGTLTIAATGLTSIVLPVTSAGAGFLPMALRIPINTACTITLSAGGSGIVGYVGAAYSTVIA